MAGRPVSLVLADHSHNESAKSRELRALALDIVKTIESNVTTARLPDCLLEILVQVIKPLFSQNQHSQLTSTGRKVLVNNALPSSINRFSSQVLFDDASKPLWKNGWTVSLLEYILGAYQRIDDQELARKTLEAHFHLLVPAILHQIDDVEIDYKVSGCLCLKLLCENMYDVQSGILARSGLTNVFVEALKNDFSLLPTLTPEDESLLLYGQLYPAYKSLVRARFPRLVATRHNTPQSETKTPADPKTSGTSVHQTVKSASPSDEQLRQSYLTLILRHQLLHALSHLSTGGAIGSTMCVTLSTFLIAQLGWIISDMGILAVVHLQVIVPLLRNVMSDPFATTNPDLLLESAKALQVIVQTCWPRIQDKWWEECLRATLTCWFIISDDEVDVKDKSKFEKLEMVKIELTTLTLLLEDVVGAEFVALKKELIEDEPVLKGLLSGKIGQLQRSAVWSHTRKVQEV